MLNDAILIPNANEKLSTQGDAIKTLQCDDYLSIRLPLHIKVGKYEN